jgi:hypothetical protein
MLAQVDLTSLAPYLAGPGAAVLVLMAVLAGLYKLVVSYAVPLVSQLGKRHLDQIDVMISVQREEGKAIAKALATIDRRLARLEGQTDAGAFVPNPGALSPDRGSDGGPAHQAGRARLRQV